MDVQFLADHRLDQPSRRGARPAGHPHQPAGHGQRQIGRHLLGRALRQPGPGGGTAPAARPRDRRRLHDDRPHPLGGQPHRGQHVPGPVRRQVLVRQQLRQQRRAPPAFRFVPQVPSFQLQGEQRDQSGHHGPGGVVRAAGEQQQPAQPAGAERLHLQLPAAGGAGRTAPQPPRGDPFDQVAGVLQRGPRSLLGGRQLPPEWVEDRGADPGGGRPLRQHRLEPVAGRRGRGQPALGGEGPV
ncbi:hypothetical protein LVX13_13475 [Streptomyces albulus]|nr:hypothetical protein [Streptomyces noursei]